MLAYIKTTDDLSDIILVVVNLDPQGRQTGNVQLPKEKLGTGDWVNVKLHDLITKERFTWTQDWNYVELDPSKMPFHLFTLEVHESYL